MGTFIAIFIPEGVEAPDRSIIKEPELQVYVSNFGDEKDDVCFVAEADKGIIGAVWARHMKDYGHIEDGIPSLAISLYQEYRGYGIGTEFMKKMLTELRFRGYNIPCWLPRPSIQIPSLTTYFQTTQQNSIMNRPPKEYDFI